MASWGGAAAGFLEVAEFEFVIDSQFSAGIQGMSAPPVLGWVVWHTL